MTTLDTTAALAAFASAIVESRLAEIEATIARHRAGGPAAPVSIDTLNNIREIIERR